MSGGGDKPVAGTEKSNTTSKASTSTTPVIPDWAKSYLQSGVQDYAGALSDLSGQFSNFNIPTDALDQLLATTRGDYLSGPEAQAQMAAIQRSIQPNVLSQFGQYGRSNNFLGADTLARSISDSYLQNVFNPERQRQISAAQLIPGTALASMFGPTEEYGTALGGINALVNPFIGSKGKTSGSSNVFGTTTPSYFPGSQSGGIAGGALAGLSAGAMTGNPYLAAGGAVLGGIGGSGLLG